MRNETLRLARLALAKSPELEKAARTWWSTVCDVLEKHYKAKRPKLMSYEVHHTNERAREAFLAAIVDGLDFPACKAAALARVGLHDE
jgi:hypothetical protein